MPGRKGQRSGGHNAKTTAQHKADGTYQPCRHSERADNAAAIGKPEKPDWLSEQQNAIWDEVVDYLPDGCVGRADTVVLREMVRIYEIYTLSMALWQQMPIDKDARLAATAAWDRFWRIVQDFGGTPVARTRLQSGKSAAAGDEDNTPRGDDPHAVLLQMRGGA